MNNTIVATIVVVLEYCGYTNNRIDQLCVGNVDRKLVNGRHTYDNPNIRFLTIKFSPYTHIHTHTHIYILLTYIHAYMTYIAYIAYIRT